MIIVIQSRFLRHLTLGGVSALPVAGGSGRDEASSGPALCKATVKLIWSMALLLRDSTGQSDPAFWTDLRVREETNGSKLDPAAL